jgi:cation transport regulator ChaB
MEMTAPATTHRYASNDDLPASVREEIPPAKHDAYRTAYNDAWDIYSKDHATMHGQSAETRAQFAHEAGMNAAKSA